tara:strand:- start:200 stop:355 length:156 start_codon:yes stop_codon:yes gene_type:complete
MISAKLSLKKVEENASTNSKRPMKLIKIKEDARKVETYKKEETSKLIPKFK